MLFSFFFCFVLIQLSDGTSIKSSSNLFFSAKKKEALKGVKQFIQLFFQSEIVTCVLLHVTKKQRKTQIPIRELTKKTFSCLYFTVVCSLQCILLSFFYRQMFTYQKSSELVFGSGLGT